MNIQQAVKSVFSKYATFSGRASRSEYWWWILAYAIVTFILSMIDAKFLSSGEMQSAVGDGEVSFTMNLGLLGGLWMLGCLLPAIAVNTRRLHDIDRSGWWQLVWLVPLVGWIVLIVFYCKKGTTGDNRFGADPLA